MTLPKLHREAWILLGATFAVAVFVTFFLVYPFDPLTPLAYAAAVLRGALLTLIGIASFSIKSLTYGRRAGLMGACVGMAMTTQSLLIPHTPWEGWAAIVATSGWLIYALCEFGPSVWKVIAASDAWFIQALKGSHKK